MSRPTPDVAAVILDFDGLIVDTETPIFEAWLAAYRRRGRSVGLEEWQHALGTHGGFDPLTHLEALLGGSLDRDAVLAEVKEATAKGCEAQPLLPGVEALLRDARALGLRRAVASSSSCGWVSGWLERHGIRDLLDVVVARDDVRKVKPDPELFLLAASRLGRPPASCVSDPRCCRTWARSGRSCMTRIARHPSHRLAGPRTRLVASLALQLRAFLVTPALAQLTPARS